MNGTQLQNRLLHCWHLSNAAYKADADNYLAQETDEYSVVDTVKIAGWKMVLVKSEGHLAVAFRGSNTKTCWTTIRERFRNIAIHLKRPVKTIEQMEHQLSEWERLHGRIRLLTGHSEGGYFASLVWRGIPDVWHVTFNGHKSKEGPHHLNLRTKEDIVSRWFGVVDRYFTVGEGPHALLSFKVYLHQPEHSEIWDAFLSAEKTRELAERLMRDPLWAGVDKVD